MAFCSNCSKKLKEGVKFCTSCGKKQSEKSEAQEEQKESKHKEKKKKSNKSTILIVIILIIILVVIILNAGLSQFSQGGVGREVLCREAKGGCYQDCEQKLIGYFCNKE